MACACCVRGDGKITILTATSGDTEKAGSCLRAFMVRKHQCRGFYIRKAKSSITRKAILYS